ncbi:hypothetical protein Emed_000174 [Eimeria media]
MMGFSYDTPQRVKPAKLRPPKPQPQQQQPLHTKQQQHALFIKARKEAAAAAAQQQQQQQLQQQPSQGLMSRQGSLSAASKTGRLVAVTTYSGSLEDYLLLHSTDDSCSGSSSDVSSPLRGSSEEDLRSSSSNLWEDHLRQQQQQQQQQQLEEEASEAQSSRKISSSSDGSDQQQQQQQQEQAEEESRQVSAASLQREQQASSSEEEQQQQEQEQQACSTSSSSGEERRLIVPPAVRTPDGVEKRQWPALTMSLLPNMGSLEDIHRIAAFTQSAAELQRVANLPIEAFSPAAAALHLQQRLKAQQLLRRPLHVTLRDGFKSMCSALKPQQTTLPPIKLPVVFPEAEEAAATAAASREQSLRSSDCSRDCSSTLEQQQQSSSSSTSGGVDSSSSKGGNCESPFEEEVSVLLQNGTTGRVVALAQDNNLVVRLPVIARPSECKFIVGGALVPPPPSPPQQQQQQQQQQELKLPANMRGAETIPSVSQLLRKAAAEAPATHNTVALPALASVCRVSTTKPSVEVFKIKTTKKQTPANENEAFAAVFPPDAQNEADQQLPEDEPALDAPACALFSPGICQPRVVRSAAEALQQKAALCTKPETATYDLIKAPGIVRPLFDIVSQPSSKPQQPRISGAELIANQQQQQQQQQQLQQQQQQMPSFLQQVPRFAELGGPAAGPAAAAAAELDLVGQKWFSDLQHNVRHDMLQQYVDTAPPSLSGGLSAAAKSWLAATQLASPHTEKRNTARVLREEVEAISYTLNPNQQQQQQQ